MTDQANKIPPQILEAVEPADGYAGNITEQATYELLQQTDAAVLVDVRTRAEWAFVGQPDVSDTGRPLLSVEWVEFPDMAPNQSFAQAVAALLDDVGAAKDAPIVFLCRSGQRSIGAAKTMTAAGYSQCFNMLGGFEGDKNEAGHRATVNGWKVAGLPWKQG